MLEILRLKDAGDEPWYVICDLKSGRYWKAKYRSHYKVTKVMNNLQRDWCEKSGERERDLAANFVPADWVPDSLLAVS